VNYDVSVSTLTKPTSFIEAGYSHGDTLLYSSAMVDPGGISSRRMTYATFDDPRHQTRTQIGDADVAGSMLLDDLPMFGVSKRRYFELDPFSYRFPAPSLGGTIATPGTANVYVNGGLIRSVQLQPRKFQSVADPRYGRQQRRCGRRPGRRWKDANVRTIVFRGQFASGERYDRLRLQRRARAAIRVRGGLWDAGAGGNLSSWRKRRRDVRWNARSDRNGAGGQIGK